MNTFSAVRRKYLHSVIAALTLSLTSSLNFASAAAAGQPLEKLIITAIPDDGDADRMRENFGALASHLGKAVGIPVEYMHVENYAASVTALATGRAQRSERRRVGKEGGRTGR